jgi:hypothetical protein
VLGAQGARGTKPARAGAEGTQPGGLDRRRNGTHPKRVRRRRQLRARGDRELRHGQRIDIRQASQGGPAAFEKALQTDEQGRKTVENTLANSLQIVATSRARKELVGGQVDARLGTLIEGMATELPQPVHILAFGDLAPGATAGLPLRSATLVGSLPTLRALRTFALAQKGNYCPTYTDLTKVGKQHVLVVEFNAPIPLELFNPPSP